MNLERVNKNSPRSLAFSAVSFSCLGGIEIGIGIQELIFRRARFDWITSFLFGVAFVCYGIFWGAILARRAAPAHVEVPTQQT
jgi:hypothetical protein